MFYFLELYAQKPNKTQYVLSLQVRFLSKKADPSQVNEVITVPFCSYVPASPATNYSDQILKLREEFSVLVVGTCFPFVSSSTVFLTYLYNSFTFISLSSL